MVGEDGLKAPCEFAAASEPPTSLSASWNVVIHPTMSAS
ncbi:hypothetical protein BCF44_106520 [Kutzneria buriramensis]|uniref:Uncharacterized protein n=1 Tax=Kutzneria buriramensis TaxID=1045776 RepID=A0A3E0HMX5_9PSEU|nr:hypothetical protein BCF44_106520 [Kutzneria buriramensis]